MLFTQERFEAYAMQTEEMSQTEVSSASGKWWVDVDEVGAKLGFTPHESRFLAHHLENAERATIDYPGQGAPPKLKLTLKGFTEISRLRRSAWRRWSGRYLTEIISIVALIVSFIALFKR